MASFVSLYSSSSREHAMSKNIQIILNPSELGAGTRGASLGPFAIQAAARKSSNHLFSDYQWKVISDWNFCLDQAPSYPFAKHIDGMLYVYNEISSSIQWHVANQLFPLIIAGDHASAGGTMLGLKQAFPGKRIGVVWIDAHADLHSPYTTPSGNLHGMPLATALGIDNLNAQKNQVDIETSLRWNQLKSGAIKSNDLIYVAVRNTEAEEDTVIAAENITLISVAQVRNNGPENVVQQILSQLEECDLIYVSFDVDAMDPKDTSYGTGTPVEHGLLRSEAEEILLGLCGSDKLAALEFVEINPTLDDQKNKMAEVALELICSCVQTLELKWKKY